MLHLSNRLRACCDYVNQGDTVADIGCDHGYLGIYLLQAGIAKEVFAADVGERPLLGAMQNARRFGVQAQMRFFRSDGLKNVPRGFDTLICAGMGGDTIVDILRAAPWLPATGCRLILQCQSHRPLLRDWLSGVGYTIRRETIAQDGKFLYPVMEAVYAPSPRLTPGQCYISPALLASGSPLLPAFYARVRGAVEQAEAGLRMAGQPERLGAYQTVLSELVAMEEAIYGNGC